jgi:hypothetical protein
MPLFPLRGLVDLWLCRFEVDGWPVQCQDTRQPDYIAERLDTVRICNDDSSVHTSFISDEQTSLLPSLPRVKDSRGLRLDLRSLANLDSFSAQPCTCRRHERLCLPAGRLSSQTGCSSCCNSYRMETYRWADAATRGVTAGRGPTPLLAKDRQR